jgi:5-oxoprolinase (ATP-hydrolysing)
MTSVPDQTTPDTEPWRIAIDTGGTFTDGVARTPTGDHQRAKILSSGRLRIVAREVDGDFVQCNVPDDLDVRALPGLFVERTDTVDHSADPRARLRIRAVDHHTRRMHIPMLAHPGMRIEPGTSLDLFSEEPAPVLAARLLTGTPPGAAFPPMSMMLTTTRGTNALLERTTARTALFVTMGFADLLRIGDQRRPDLFALNIIKPTPVTDDVYEIIGRYSATGEEVTPFDRAHALRIAGQARADGATVAAIALMHSWTSPMHEHMHEQTHEYALRHILREAGFEVVRCSCDVAPSVGVLRRAVTTTVDAGLTPVVGAFLDDITRAMPSVPLRIMSSTGGIVPRAEFSPVDSLLSGPAGGVIGARAVAASMDRTAVISFDMGGTSTDVARFEQVTPIVFAHQVGDAHLARPAVDIETVAAGGGSICTFDAGRPRVGPDSARAHPGPACYGAGGPLTLTDVNLLLGRIDAERFEIPIDVDAARRALDDVLARAARQPGAPPDAHATLIGFRALADERTADAIRKVSVRRGYDPADHTLIAFGGAGPQHACAVADHLGICDVIIPADASILSAHGVLSSDLERIVERTLHAPLDDIGRDIESWYDAMLIEARTSLAPERTAQHREHIRRILSVRVTGQEHSIELEDDRASGPIDDPATAFRRKYVTMFHHPPPERPLECTALRIVLSLRHPAEIPTPTQGPHAGTRPEPRTQRCVLADGARTIEVHERSSLVPGVCIEGPALIVEAQTITMVDVGWTATAHEHGALVLTHSRDRAPSLQLRTSDLMQKELLVSRLSGIAETMGEQLRRTALSPNIRERLDYSCGVFDITGRLVASAPHIPVHLGALSVCVRAVRDALGGLHPGDVAMTNHPAFGGSHLPDVTVIHPVHNDHGALLAYVASRAHHAEIGGRTPGSMPPDARTLIEEGVLLPALRIVEGGASRWEEVEDLLRHAEYPSRAVDDNRADIFAAIVAGNVAAEDVRALCAEASREDVHAAMAWIIDHTRDLVVRALDALPSTAWNARQSLDDGSSICVSIRCAQDPATARTRCTVDFAGTAPTHRGNFNAPPAVVRSALAYVMRLLVARPVPLNEGLLACIDLHLPANSMLNPTFDDDPRHAPAVAAGNVETSQHIVTALVRAFGLAADSQTTMNNVLFGNARFGSYETVCGGAGASASAPGASAVHTHMTNTAIADPEILECSYPVRVQQFAIRRNSGGAGANPGGDGAIRELEMLDAVTLSVIGQRRLHGPLGAAGGGDGAPGRQVIIRADGTIHPLAGVDGAELGVGDRLRLETPGGGGWGPAEG